MAGLCVLTILYYNAVIWLTPNLRSDLKQNLLSASACALRICFMPEGFEMSFDNWHKIHKNAPRNRSCTSKCH